MVAYDPMLHAAKNASFQANKEVVVLEVPGKKTKYAKVVFIGFGASQIDNKLFDGSSPLNIRVMRDKTCDENSPILVNELNFQQRSGTYLLTDAYKASPPKIRKAECFYATGKTFEAHHTEEDQQ